MRGAMGGKSQAIALTDVDFALTNSGFPPARQDINKLVGGVMKVKFRGVAPRL